MTKVKMPYICTKFSENIGNGFKVLEWTSFHTKIINGQNSVTYEDGDMVLILRILSDDALYTYVQSFMKVP